jgi:hypothetical protein
MSFEPLSYLAQIVGSVGVIVSLIFVGLQKFLGFTLRALTKRWSIEALYLDMRDLKNAWRV